MNVLVGWILLQKCLEIFCTQAHFLSEGFLMAKVGAYF